MYAYIHICTYMYVCMCTYVYEYQEKIGVSFLDSVISHILNQSFRAYRMSHGTHKQGVT